MIVRQAGLEDARAIAAIHVRSWRVAYQRIVPPAVLAALSIDGREQSWRQALERGATRPGWRRGTLRSSDGSAPDEAAMPDADAPPSTGEVWALYVDPPHWRRRVGRRLWHEAETYLGVSGFSEVTVWVLKENVPAIAFYESVGLAIEPGREETATMGGAELIEIRLRRQLTE